MVNIPKMFLFNSLLHFQGAVGAKSPSAGNETYAAASQPILARDKLNITNHTFEPTFDDRLSAVTTPNSTNSKVIQITIRIFKVNEITEKPEDIETVAVDIDENDTIIHLKKMIQAKNQDKYLFAVNQKLMKRDSNNKLKELRSESEMIIRNIFQEQEEHLLVLIKLSNVYWDAKSKNYLVSFLNPDRLIKLAEDIRDEDEKYILSKSGLEDSYHITNTEHANNTLRREMKESKVAEFRSHSEFITLLTNIKPVGDSKGDIERSVGNRITDRIIRAYDTFIADRKKEMSAIMHNKKQSTSSSDSWAALKKEIKELRTIYYEMKH